MSERMIPIPFAQLMNWLATELQREGTAFGVHRPYFAGEKKLPIFGGEYIETPFGPAAGPNTKFRPAGIQTGEHEFVHHTASTVRASWPRMSAITASGPRSSMSPRHTRSM